MIVLSVPPIDGVVLTPALARYVDGYMLEGVDVALLDIGISGARMDGARKARRAYEFYMDSLKALSSLETPPSRILLVVPDSFDIRQHLRLAETWRMYARKIEREWSRSFRTTYLFVVRRFLRSDAADREATRRLAEYVEEYRGVAVPANIDTADHRDVKCAREPSICIAHIRAALETFGDVAEWRHVLGPPIKAVLSRIYGDPRIDSADTTSHRLDILSRLGTRRPSTLHLLTAYASYIRR